mmetsp:Transcript_6124/g.14780  ORF Transcript_6124/g.14780 Transcript_6124/m.14780 type:complete len:87 (+) Transcript_6124:539-799(+)
MVTESLLVFGVAWPKSPFYTRVCDSDEELCSVILVGSAPRVKNVLGQIEVVVRFRRGVVTGSGARSQQSLSSPSLKLWEWLGCGSS